MAVEQALVALLANSTSAAERIYPLILPQSPTLPAVTYQEISATNLHAMGADRELTRVRMQVNAWASTYGAARQLASELVTTLSRYRGTVGTVTIYDALLDNETTTYEPDLEVRRVLQDYTIIFAE